MASRIIPGIIFTVDLPSRNKSGRVPMLDLCVWKEEITKEGMKGTRIRHSYYEKPSTSPTVFHGRGATSTRSKIVTLAEEVKRRLANILKTGAA